MKFMVSTAIANMVWSADPEVEFRIEAQAEALKENKCIDTLVGQWIDANDLEYLNAVLDLADCDFAQRFPSVAHVTHERRQQMKAEIGSHLSRCIHCSLKHGFELELDSRIMRACRENREDLLRLLKDQDVDLAEGDRPAAESWNSNSEPQSDTYHEPEIIIEPLAEPV